MKIIVTPDASGLVSAAGQIIGQAVADAAVLVEMPGNTLDIPPNSAAVLQDGDIVIVPNWIGSGPWYDQESSTEDRLTPIEITELGLDPRTHNWAMTPRAETSAEIAAKEAAQAAALAAAEAARIANLEVARYAALVALLGAGITEQMIADHLAEIVDATEREHARLYFNRPAWRRSSSFIAWGMAEFGLTAAQVDALFIAASAID